MDDDELGARVGSVMAQLFPEPTDLTIGQTRRPRRPHRIVAAMVLTVVGTLVVAAVVSWLMTSVRKSKSAAPVPTATAIQTRTPTDCATPASIGDTIAITLTNTAVMFDAPCYYARAERPLTLHFTNDIITAPRTGSAEGVPARLVISLMSRPAFTPETGRPGFYSGTTKDAVFVSDSIVAPMARTYTISPLPPGEYIVQNFEGRPIVTSTLILTAP